MFCTSKIAMKSKKKLQKNKMKKRPGKDKLENYCKNHRQLLKLGHCGVKCSMFKEFLKYGELSDEYMGRGNRLEETVAIFTDHLHAKNVTDSDLLRCWKLLM